MITYKEIQKSVKEPIKIECDRCGKEHKEFSLEPEILEFKQEFGYGSKRDGDFIEFDLCEDCLMEILKQEKIKYRLYTNFVNI